MKDIIVIKLKLQTTNQREETISFMSKSITQDMAYRQSLMNMLRNMASAMLAGNTNKSRSYIYFWKARWDGSVTPLACHSRRLHSHPNQHTEEKLK